MMLTRLHSMRPVSFALAAVAIAASTLVARADFALRDGDTVVFLGDSITAARQYGKIIEDYTLLRFPDRKVRFVNAGKGGETAKGSLERLERDVFGRGATVVTVAYGVNDIGWGMKADDEHKQEYLSAIGELVDRCHRRNVRVFVCSAAITAEDPDKAEKGFLQKMCDDGLALAKSHGAETIDVQRGMRGVQRRVVAANAGQSDKSKQTRLHVEDGIHLNELGQMAMAYSILKGLGAPADVSAATIDAEKGTAQMAEGCRISDVEKAADGVSFTRIDERLPLNLAPLWMLQGAYIPIGDELNRYSLSVKGLSPGQYAISAGNRPLGKWKAAELERGINIASATADGWQPGGPWDAQAHALKVYTDMRDEVVQARRGMEANLAAHPDLPKLVKEANEIEERIIALQRDTARPIPVQFRVQKVAEEAKRSQRIEAREFTYSEIDGQKLGIDLYLPPPPTASSLAKRPAVLLIHGGGWVGGNRRDVANEARALASLGYVTFSASYRFCNGPERLDNPSAPVRNRYPAQLDDCQRAVRWIRSRADEFGIDPDRLAAIGWSAGGHLVSLLGTLDTRDNSDRALAAFSSRVNAVVDVFGPADFTRPLPDTTLLGQTVDPKATSWMARQPVRWLQDDLLGSTEVAAQKDASPLHHVDGKTVPFLIVHGDVDKIVPVEQSRTFYQTLKDAGIDAKLVVFPDEGHGFGKPDNQRRFADEVIAFLGRTINPTSKP